MNEANNKLKPPFAPLDENSFDGLSLARKLLRAIPAGALATLAKDTFYPFVTLTSVATLHDGAPLLLLSTLAHHTANLRADSRVSLLLAEGGKGDPLAHPRLTVVGRVSPLVDTIKRNLWRNRFLRRHPKAELYVDFSDFGFWRLDPEGAHLNGGFARAADYSGADLLTPVSDAGQLIEAEDGILDEINAGPREVRGALAAAAGEDKRSQWRASGLDPDGLDLVCGQSGARIAFARSAQNPAQWRDLLAQATA